MKLLPMNPHPPVTKIFMIHSDKRIAWRIAQSAWREKIGRYALCPLPYAGSYYPSFLPQS